MKYARLKSTDQILMAEPDGQREDQLLEGMLSSGYAREDIEIISNIPIAEYTRLTKEQNEAAKSYAIKRKAEYPPMTDYLDGIVKGDQAQIDKYISDCLAIKEKYPKE